MMGCLNSPNPDFSRLFCSGCLPENNNFVTPQARSKAFNMVNESVSGGALPDTQIVGLMRVITEALGSGAAVLSFRPRFEP
jgi:hypothetical protein